MDSSEMASAVVASSVVASGAASSDSALGGATGIPSGVGRLIRIGIGAARTGGITRGDTMLRHRTLIGATRITMRIRIRTMGRLSFAKSKSTEAH